MFEYNQKIYHKEYGKCRFMWYLNEKWCKIWIKYPNGFGECICEISEIRIKV